MTKRSRAERDRLFGQGLPATISDAALHRIGRRLSGEPQPRVFSTRTAVLAAGFEPVAGQPDVYRHLTAHSLWQLRPAEAEGDSGYVLVRTHDEPAPDLLAKAASRQFVAMDLCPDCEEEPQDCKCKDAAAAACKYAVGQRVAVIRRGQLADAMIVFVNPSEELADVVFDDGETARDMPTDQLLEAESASDTEGDDDMVEVELVPLLSGAGGAGDPFVL